MRATRADKPRRLQPIDHLKDLYEGAAKTMTSNKPVRFHQKKDILDAVRRLTPTRHSHRPKASSLQRKRTSPDDNYDADPVENNELKNLSECVHIHTRKFNHLKAKVREKQTHVDLLMETLSSLSKEIDSLRRMEQDDTPETIRIKALRESIESAEAKIGQKAFVRQQLEQMSRRYQSDEVAFDMHVKGMEDALEASKKEFEEVKLLLRHLQAKKQECIAELQRTQIETSLQHKARQRRLEERRKQANNARRMEEWRKKRSQRADSGVKSPTNSPGEESKGTGAAAVEEKRTVVKRSKMDNDKAMTFEEAFIQIRQATGVTTLEEMVEKFMGQKANKEALMTEKRDAEAQLKAVRQQQQVIEERFAAMKASGIGGSELNREIYDRLDDEITLVKKEYKESVTTNQRLEEVLLNVRLGVTSLMRRWEAFAHLMDPQEEAELPKSGNQTLDNLMKAQVRLRKLIEVITTKKGPLQSHLEKTDSGKLSMPDIDVERWTPSNDGSMHRNNVRVDSMQKTIERLSSDVGDLDGEQGMNDHDDSIEFADIRGALKRTSAKRTGKKKKAATMDVARDLPELAKSKAAVVLEEIKKQKFAEDALRSSKKAAKSRKSRSVNKRTRRRTQKLR